MQSYREEAGSRPVTTQLDPLPAPAGRADDMGKYRTRYEEAMNPFEAFRGRVRRLFSLYSLVPLMSCLGSNESLSESQPRRAECPRTHTIYSGESPRPNVLHSLRPGSACFGHVHDI